MTSAAQSSSPVPAQNSAANTTTAEVIGNKTDDSDGNSVYSILHTLEEHAHSIQKVLPDLASPVTATAAVGAWTYGAASASLGTPSDDFDIHWAEIVANNNDDYQAQILVDGVVVSEIVFQRINVQNRSFSKRIQMPVTAPGPITIKLASAAGSSTATFKVEYHEY